MKTLLALLLLTSPAFAHYPERLCSVQNGETQFPCAYFEKEKVIVVFDPQTGEMIGIIKDGNFIPKNEIKE